MNYETVAHDAYLAHHGVKGMKWGVRRHKKSEGSRSRRGKKQKTTRNPRKMTDAQLRAGIERNRLEREYRRSRTDASSDGRQFVKSMGTIAVSTLIGTAVPIAVKTAAKRYGLKKNIDIYGIGKKGN